MLRTWRRGEMIVIAKVSKTEDAPAQFEREVKRKWYAAVQDDVILPQGG